MAFRKPFRAVPIRPAARYRRARPERKGRFVASIFGSAAFFGLALGAASAGAIPGWAAIEGAIKPLAVWAGVMRARAPQAGDSWPGCNEARAVGTAPIYAGEPGYREEMDGDGDGIACEPYRGA